MLRKVVRRILFSVNKHKLSISFVMMEDTEINKEDLISQFCSFTRVEDLDRAKFYLESSRWQIDVAVAAFFENDDSNPEIEEIEMPPRQLTPPEEEVQPVGAESGNVPKKKDTRSRFGTIQSLSSDDQPEEEGQAFYAGGSERSGQQVLGPPRKKPDELIKDMFKSASSHGAQEVDPSEVTQHKKRHTLFQGSGARLGNPDDDVQEIVPSATSSRPPKEVRSILKLWQNGFSVDNGDLRSYSDPENADFLEAIRSGEIPKELVRDAKGGMVELNMEDHRGDEYKPVKGKPKLYSGKGQVLGSPVVEVLTNISTATASAASESSSNDTSTSNNPITVDASQPVTNIQLRLADGSRAVVKMNHNHTVQDLITYIITMYPRYKLTPFKLMTTFPNKELTDSSASLVAAGLLNSVIVQRIP